MNTDSSNSAPPIPATSAVAPSKTIRPLAAAPMSSAPMLYNEDGSVAWEQMWGTFCDLASASGPPHRGQMLFAPRMEDPTTPAYQQVCDELIRGIQLVSGLKATPVKPGWLAVQCANAAQARWLSEQIMQENVESFADGDYFYLPVSGSYTHSGEIKNVVTVVAKTTHYWQEHVEGDVKTVLVWEARILGALRSWRRPKK